MKLTLQPPVPVDPPFKHVIDEYKHSEQLVTCTCGWRGTSASVNGYDSEWKAHLTAVRGPSTRSR